MTRTLGEKPKAETHYCAQCKKRLRANFELEWRRVDFTDATQGYETVAHYTGKIRGYGYRCDGWFCSRGCGYNFGVSRAIQEDMNADPDPNP